MKAEKIRLPDVSEDEDRLINGLLEQLDDRKPRNLLRASYYDGKRAIRQVGTVIPPQYYQLGIVLGWSAKAVDTLARRCNLDGFVWPDGDLKSLGLDQVADDNHLFAEIASAKVSTLIYGISFAINTVGGNDEPRSLVHFKDALNATGEWNSRTRQMNNLLSIIDRDKENCPTELAVYLDGETISAQKVDGKWLVDRSTHQWGVPVDALVYRPRHDRPFGSSRISRPVMSLHDQALRTVIRMEGHMDVYSFPEMWMLGADSKIFKNPDGSLKPVWQTMLSRIKGIPDNPDGAVELARPEVKKFDASDPKPHLDALKQQAQLFSGETNIPLTSLGVSDMSNPTSADSYIASREDLIAEAEGATSDWSLPLRRTLARALAIANDVPVDPRWSTIDAKWRSPVFLSRAAQADAGMKQLAAVPWLAETEVGLELLGLNEQQITRALAQKDRQGVMSLVDKLTASPVTEIPSPASAERAPDAGSGI